MEKVEDHVKNNREIIVQALMKSISRGPEKIQGGKVCRMRSGTK